MDEKNNESKEKEISAENGISDGNADNNVNGKPSFFGSLKKRVTGYIAYRREQRKDPHYISGSQAHKIAAESLKKAKYYEKQKNRKVSESEYLAKMDSDDNVIEFRDLHTCFFTDLGTVKAVDGVSFDVPENSVVGIVGESGCGKSVLSLSAMQLVQGPRGQIVSGEIRYKNSEGKCFNIAKMPVGDMKKIRGREIAMIFQEPMTSLNPIFTIGNQLDEVSLLHIHGVTKQQAKERSIEMLKLVGMSRPEAVYKSYPHELSGGMRQRVMIAMALICNPRLIIADEPTTALDVTIQAQVLDLLKDIKGKINGSIMLITHDLGVIAEMADYVVVMYAGRVVERGTVRDIFKNPMHPYTIGLQKSKPVVNKKVDELFSISGSVPNPVDMPDYCYFKDRCDRCVEACKGEYPELIQISPTHSVACYLYRGEVKE